MSYTISPLLMTIRAINQFANSVSGLVHPPSRHTLYDGAKNTSLCVIKRSKEGLFERNGFASAIRSHFNARLVVQTSNTCKVQNRDTSKVVGCSLNCKDGNLF